MIVKAVFLFLIAIAVLGMFGKLRMPRLPGAKGPKFVTRTCKACGAPVPGGGTCPCGRNR
ncbi:hypothetical protein [Oceanomicrobium pacificus]|uniref:Uncharacterized protein n=1 Tax=Oceanomicrobium pacificus TaxID=2692916 RepID=A0A6B0TQ26_9RHOB|nr:hypothetical protein [Oceanomicrobium pacificus]MXU66780.1 hypothetical protein [Oceanomicrobium pacificus]